jgi:PTS system mannose-specific IIA component
MIGIVIAGHGHLASELIATAELIVGPLPAVLSCNISPSLSPREMEEQLRLAILEVDQGQGVLVLADLIGGTPCTRSMALCRKAHLEVVTGVNLPMVLKAHSLRTSRPLRELAAALVESVRGSVRWVTESVPEPQNVPG